MCLPDQLSEIQLPKAVLRSQGSFRENGDGLAQGGAWPCCSTDPGSVNGPCERPRNSGSGNENHDDKGQV